MFPVPRMATAIEVEWAEMLSDRAGCTVADFLARPTFFMNYPIETLRVELMDGSTASFKYAFALVNPDWKAIGVFTEHCGHHVFPWHEARVWRDEILDFDQRDA